MSFDDLGEGCPLGLMPSKKLVGLEIDRNGFNGHALIMHLTEQVVKRCALESLMRSQNQSL